MSSLNETLYEKIYNYLVGEINSGKYDETGKLPTEKELDEMFKVSRITSKKALQSLVDDNIIVRIPGKGSFVKNKPMDLDKSTIKSSFNKSSTNKNRYLLGIILPDFSESFGLDLLSGIENGCFCNNCDLILRRSYGNQSYEEKALGELIEIGVDGFAIMPVHGEYYNKKILRLILDDFPHVVMDRKLTGVASSFVGTDNITAAKNAIKYLLDLGHDKIALFSLPSENTSTLEDRIKGVIDAHVENNIIVDRSYWFTEITCTLPARNIDKAIRDDITKIKNHILSKPDITAAFALEYNVALLVQKAALEIGLKIPDDLSIICFDSPNSFLHDYKFTHIIQNQKAMGLKVVELLCNSIKMARKGKKAEFFTELFEGKLIIGTSTTYNNMNFPT